MTIDITLLGTGSPMADPEPGRAGDARRRQPASTTSSTADAAC